MKAIEEVRVADEAWVSLALLHRRNPDRQSFSAREILDCAIQEKIHPEARPGLQAHIYLHNVANAPPNSARYRMFYRLADGTFRLFRPRDDHHPDRLGKTRPQAPDLPAEYRELVDWYEREYCREGSTDMASADPVLQMLGVGAEIWTAEGGDAFITRERAGWDIDNGAAVSGPFAPVRNGTVPPENRTLEEKVWERISGHQGEAFRTVRGLSFTYQVEANSGIWFFREGKRIDKRLGRGDVTKAIRRCPLKKVTDIADCFDPAYLFGLLMDARIRGNDW